MKPVLFNLSQHRGQWYATVNDTRSKQALGADRLAVVRDWENGMLDWQHKPPRYVEHERDGWWTHPAAATWRSLLTEGAAVWVRKVKHDESKNASVGRSVGVWRITQVNFETDQLGFVLSERLGDAQ